jgi:uncharacterized membrane protein YeiH
MFDTIVTALDWSGTAVFAATGALVAARKGMDIFGFAALAIATGIGGGTIRDLILGISPVTWVSHSEYLQVCTGVAVLSYFTVHMVQARYRLLMWLDAVGLSLFTIVGAARALDIGAAPPVAVMMGIATATFGGIVRNILAGEASLLLAKEIYPAAAFAGASAFVAGHMAGLPGEAAGLIGFAACFAVRGLALHYGWEMPAYKPRGSSKAGRSGID